MHACPSHILIRQMCPPPPPCPALMHLPTGAPRSKAQANWFHTLVSTLGLASGWNVVTGAIILVGPIVIAVGYTEIIGLRAQLFISDFELFWNTAHLVATRVSHSTATAVCAA
jgi:hypothetical protein